MENQAKKCGEAEALQEAHDCMQDEAMRTAYDASGKRIRADEPDDDSPSVAPSTSAAGSGSKASNNSTRRRPGRPAKTARRKVALGETIGPWPLNLPYRYSVFQGPVKS